MTTADSDTELVQLQQHVPFTMVENSIIQSLGDVGLVVVDYIQLMTGRHNAESRQVEVSEISRGLKILARELECPVVALAQLNRGLEQRADKRPMLSDLRESGSLEQDADMVILLSRPDLYDRDSERAGEADFDVAKHRNGPTKTITVAFQGHYSRFTDISHDLGPGNRPSSEGVA